MDNTRVSGLTRSYEEFCHLPGWGLRPIPRICISGQEWIMYIQTWRLMTRPLRRSVSMDSRSRSTFTKLASTQPVWSHTFSKVNTPPTISNITDQTANEDTATGAIPFTVGDVELNPDYLSVTAASSDLTLVPAGNISLGGSGADRTIDISAGRQRERQPPPSPFR